MTDDVKLQTLRETLLQRLRDLDALTEATEGDRKPVELDQTAVGRLSRMDSMQVQAMAAASQHMRHLERKRIESTLKRIDDGDYGWCASCGEPIAPERLAVDPTIAVCIGCASGRT